MDEIKEALNDISNKNIIKPSNKRCNNFAHTCYGKTPCRVIKNKCFYMTCKIKKQMD